METPVIKGTSGVLFFDEVQEKEQDETFCIRCGECVENCPVGLNPSLLAMAIAKDKLDFICHQLPHKDWPGLFFTYKLVLLEMWYQKVVQA